MEDVLPKALESFCVFHIEKNQKTKFHTTLDGQLFKAAKAMTLKDFHDVMNRMKWIHEEAWDYIEGTKPEEWARALFPVRRYGHVTSNIAESANARIDYARHFDPVGVFSMYIFKLNGIIEKRRTKFASLPADALPSRVAKRPGKSVEQSRSLKVSRHNMSLFQVQAAKNSGDRRTVNL